MDSINIFPQTQEAMNAFRQMLQVPNNEIPIVEMNDPRNGSWRRQIDAIF